MIHLSLLNTSPAADRRCNLHISNSDRHTRREKQHRTDKQHPDHRHPVDIRTPCSQREGPLDELDSVPVEPVRQDHGYIGYIKCWGSDAEDRSGGFGRADGNAV